MALSFCVYSNEGERVCCGYITGFVLCYAVMPAQGSSYHGTADWLDGGGARGEDGEEWISQAPRIHVSTALPQQGEASLIRPAEDAHGLIFDL